MAAAEKGNLRDAPTNNDMEEIYFLNFPPDIDWSTTLVLRCDPEGGPYKLIDVANGLHDLVRRNDVHFLGPTALSHVFTISFRTERMTENFMRNLRDRRAMPLQVKKRPCQVARIPSHCVTVSVRWIPVDVDTAFIVEELKKYGTIVKTDLIRCDAQGWFHVYTGERKFSILLHEGVAVEHLPYTIVVKGLAGAVSVAERNPKCLECYFSGHQSSACKYQGCYYYRQ